ncbi:hypothetical protein HYT02_06065 [Candidatus Gottesmanbacteria bacterium]|nr:hypothetical protein [Candidatus Gottesmanbacteria bacterium]
MLTAERIKSTEKIGLTTIRTYIDLMFDESPDFVTGAFGIELIERAGDRPNDENCFQSVFGKTEFGLVFPKLIKIKGLPPPPGSIALYYDDSNTTICHVGLTTADGKIISKWGLGGHVFKHPPHHTLSEYGHIKKYCKYIRE